MPPFFREVGAGPGVVCLHANSSSSSQWRGLSEALAPRFHVLSADSYGSGKSPPWPTGRTASLRDEVELLEPVFQRAGEPFVLVGHSYGAAIALVAALAQPHRVRALALYEPVLFSLITEPPPNDADGIREASLAAIAALDAGDLKASATHFIDYWMGRGMFSFIPEPRAAPMMATMVNLRPWWDALTEPQSLEAFRDLTMPILYMTGSRSPASSLGVARRLIPVLPNVEKVELEGLGHMAPIMNAQTINEHIIRFLDRL